MKHLKHLAATVAMLLCCVTATFAETITLNDWTSTNHEHNTTSSETYTFTVTSQAAELTFDWTVDCESADKLIVTLDGSKLLERGGITSGAFTKKISGGEHVLVVQYRKDGSVHTASDQVTVSNIAITDIEPLNIGGLRYIETSANTAMLVGTDELTEVVVPSSVTIDEVEHTVNAIGSLAFAGCSNLSAITIPSSVTSIGAGAFADCTGELILDCHIPSASSAETATLYGSKFAKVTIGEHVTSIGNYAFAGMSSLASITIPANVTNIYYAAFDDCTGLKEVTFADGNNTLSLSYNLYNSKGVGEGLFYDCPLEKVYIGRNLSYNTNDQSINYTGYSPFYGKSSLTSVAIAEGVTSIGRSAFRNCNSLTSITLPEGVTSIGSDAFRNCSSLTSIILPEGVTSIGSYAFYNCSSLTSITLPEGVTSIGGDAFRNCSSLISIILPEGVTSIGSSAFCDCSSLTSIILPEGVASIGSDAFYNCSSLTSIILPEGVTSIPSCAFYNCSSLTSITIPEGVTSISSDAFRNCSSLTSITIPEGVTSIGAYAFNGCNGLKDLIVEDGEKDLVLAPISNYSNSTYTYGAFYGLPLESVYLGRNLKDANTGSKPMSHFGYCQKLESVEIGNTVTNIPSYIFYACSSLTFITLQSANPATLASATLAPTYTLFVVPAAAYNDYVTANYWADLASQITIDDANARMKSVALTAEADKSALHVAIGDEDLKFVTDLTISGSINSYDFMVMRNKMPSLRYLDLEDATIVANDYQHYTGYCTQDNKFPGHGLYNCKLISLTFPKNITSVGYSGVAENIYLSDVTLFEGVSSIGGNAFYNCDALTAITLPEGVTSIGNNAFQNSGALTNITFLDGLTSIGSHAFQNCSGLESVVLPPTVKTIGVYAFSSCSNLKEIRIPSSIRSVGDYAFGSCSNLNDVYVYTVEPINIGQNTFDKNGNNFTGTLHAPKVSYWEYYYDTQWSQFTSFVEFDEPYENFYLQGDKVLDSETGAIEGEGDDAPDAEMGSNSGIIVEDSVEQDLGDVDIEHNGSDGGSIIVGGEGCVNADELHFHINVLGGRWYFFCFPFDVRREDIVLQNGAEWVFRYYDGEERAKNGKGGWKNVTSDGNGNHLKAATGYIFQCSKNDVLILTAKNQKIKQEKKYNELVEHITGNAHDASWNFVGNPYLSYYEVTSDDYSAPITVWDGSKYIAIRPGDDDYQLAPFEAFFVQKPGGVANVDYSPERQMTYHQSQKAAAKARARRRTMPVDPTRLLVNITLSNGTDTDQTRVVFNNDAALGYEATCDAAKFSTAGMPQLYTVDSRAVKYAINERPAEEGIVTMGYTAPAEGNYTLAAPRMDIPIVVKDNLTGTIHDFSDGDYTFMTQAGTFEDRFTVMTKAGTTGIDRLESTDNSQQPIYDAAGRRVEKMEQGIYIKENRKVVRL